MNLLDCLVLMFARPEEASLLNYDSAWKQLINKKKYHF